MIKVKNLFSLNTDSKAYELDTLVTQLFSNDFWENENIVDYYISSDIEKDRYFRFKVDNADEIIIRQENVLIDDFDSLGTNEKYLLNKIMFNNIPLTVLVGTIGSGKTTLCKFVQEKLKNVNLPNTNLPPLQIHINLSELPEEIKFNTTNDAEILEKLYDFLIDIIEINLRKDCFLTLNEEVIEVWNDVIKSDYLTLFPMFRKVVRGLQNRNIDSIDIEKANATFSQILRERIAFRITTTEESKHNYCNYLFELLNHINTRKFAKNRWGIVIYVDSLDELSPHSQNVIISTLIPLLSKSKSRSIVMMRVSTWRMGSKLDVFSDLLDSIPHCGVMPITAVIQRIEKAKTMPPEAFGSRIYNKEKWIEHLDYILKHLNNNHSIISTCINNVCGYSIRKAFIVCQYLLIAFEYETQNHLKDVHIKRMLLAQGLTNHYNWSYKNPVENLFQVQGGKSFLPLLKLRILFMLSKKDKNEGIELGKIKFNLGWFGYDNDDIRIAINELMHPHKRLVWCDSLLEFTSSESFEAASKSNIYGSTFANGFINLVSDYDYFTEMIMDTWIPPKKLAINNKSRRKVNFINEILVYLKFLTYLVKLDFKETLQFIEKTSLKEFKSIIGDNYITQNFIPQYIVVIEKISKTYHTDNNLKIHEQEDFINLKNLVSMPLQKMVDCVEVIEDDNGSFSLKISEMYHSSNSSNFSF